MSNNTWRPNKLEEVFGQDHIKPILNQWLEDTNKIPKSLLLHGPYGDGKTTVARILARALADEGDIMETNAAEQRGIDDVRALAESTRFMGFGGTKVYILDELHELTKQAQSALLKVIEEPPKGIYFILCTTNPSALQPMIRSRCHKLEFRNFNKDSCFQLTTYLTGQHGKHIDRETSDLIFMNAEGHGRDIVKQVETFLQGGQITYTEVKENGVISGFHVEQQLAQWFETKQVDWDMAFRILNCGDTNLLSRTLDTFVDHWFVSHEVLRKNYLELLEARIWRKEYKADSTDQWRHFLAILSREWYPA